MPKQFQKKIEDFTCEHCQTRVTGSGYTNHCPICLWSKHVDINPGDRAANCHGMMPPIGLILRHGKKVIIHRCLKCSHKKMNSIVPSDNQELIIKLSTKPVKLND